MSLRSKGRLWFNDKGKFELIGLKGGGFQSLKPSSRDGVDRVLLTHNFRAGGLQTRDSSQYVTLGTERGI